MFYIGCHLSASGGYASMGKQAVSIGASTFAFFTRNPRGNAAKAVDPDDVREFLGICRDNSFGKLVAHAPYTMNLCSADAGIRKFAKDTLADDLKRMEHIPGNYYNLHPGSHVKQGTEAGIDLIARQLGSVLTQSQSVTVLLETMAGKGSEVGCTFEELREIIDRTEHGERLGVCFDTCHVWDAGYDIAGDLDGVLEKFDNIIGLERLKAVHLNDSKNPLGSHKDRHEKIGEGQIGADALIRVINNEHLRGLPFILETPNDIEGYAEEISFLKRNYSG